MSRQPGAPMRRLLALHEDWREANGYPLQVSREKKKQNFTNQGTGARHNLQAKSPKTKAQAQAACLKFPVSQKV